MNFQGNKKNTLARVGHPPSTVHRLPSIVYCLFALVLPVSLSLATWVMWLALVVAVFTVSRQSFPTYRSPSTVHHLPSTVLATFFFLHVIALTYTSNVQAGTSELLFKSPLLVFPLVVWLMPPKREDVRQILLCFVVGCILTGLICFTRSLINYYQVRAVSSWLGYTWLSSQMGFLPAYLALYMSFAFFVVLFDLVKRWRESRIWIKIMWFSALIFTVYMLVVLGARLVGVTFFVLLTGVFLMWMARRKALLLGIPAVIIFMLGLWKLVFTLPITRMRANKIIGKRLKDYDHDFFININDPRGQIWESCLAAIERMPMWGYGIGDEVERILLQMYDLKNYHHLLIVDTNAHSQYVQTFLSLGYLGLICLVVMLVVPFYLNWKRKNYLYLLFLLLISIPMLTECMLENAHGLMYFSFFSSLLSSPDLVELATRNS